MVCARSAAEINLNWLVMSYHLSKNKTQFFNDFFDKLAGTAQLKKQILDGKSVLEIKQSWQNGLDKYRVMQRPYLLFYQRVV